MSCAGQFLYDADILQQAVAHMRSTLHLTAAFSQCAPAHAAICSKMMRGRTLPAGQDGVKTGNWRSARYTGRRSLKGGDHYVIVQQDDTPSPPPPSKVIIKKSSPCPSPPPSSSVTNPALQLHHYCM